MALFDKKVININSKILALINRRRRQILVHSYLYYKEDVNLIDDFTFDKWCRELFELQNKYQREAAKAEFQKAFKEWNGFSGYDLFKDDVMAGLWARQKATQLMFYRNSL